MPVAMIGPSDTLPQTHCFVSIAWGGSIRTIRMRIGIMRVCLAAIAALACWLVASSLFLVFHDDLVATLMAREASTQYAYEDRIAALRSQVEREASQQLVGQTTLDARLHDLATRATALEARASLLAQIGPHTGVASGTSQGSGTQLDGDVTGSVHDRAAKPHPDIEGRATIEIPGALNARAGSSFAIRMAGVEERLERIDAAQFRSLAVVGERTRHRLDVMRAAIESAGLTPDRVTTKAKTEALGGPYVPLDPALTGSAFGHALETMEADLSAAGGLAQALPHIPFATPLTGPLEVTSPFGARLDPFMGRPAMHTGVDFAESYGTDVRATAAGRVVTAGPTGGYGTMIEVDHGHGLSTRYAHLSSVGVSVGQLVDKGEVIGEVGATGRATGPHLHYETRIDGEAVDPLRFLNAGAHLAAIEAIP